MFTGIVQGVARIDSVSGNESLKSFKICFPDKAIRNVKRGASIAINGTCLTVTSFDEEASWAIFDVMYETLKLTNIGALKADEEVNFERAASIGDEIGGHLMSGHIHCTVEVDHIEAQDRRHSLFFKTPEKFKKYLLPKGFAGLNGCSLTLSEDISNTFAVHLIPETLEITTFGKLNPGNLVNLEIDPQTQTIVDTVERMMEQKKPV